MNYKQANEELQKIVAEIETGKVEVDELSEKVKRAAQLIKICKDKLTEAEGDINVILSELTEESK
jgi:exodeoxyribonuclease VII small subunit